MPHRRAQHPSEEPLSRADQVVLAEIAELMKIDAGLANRIAEAWFRRACRRCDAVRRAYHLLRLAETANLMANEVLDDFEGGKANDNE